MPSTVDLVDLLSTLLRFTSMGAGAVAGLGLLAALDGVAIPPADPAVEFDTVTLFVRNTLCGLFLGAPLGASLGLVVVVVRTCLGVSVDNIKPDISPSSLANDIYRDVNLKRIADAPPSIDTYTEALRSPITEVRAYARERLVSMYPQDGPPHLVQLIERRDFDMKLYLEALADFGVQASQFYPAIESLYAKALQNRARTEVLIQFEVTMHRLAPNPKHFDRLKRILATTSENRRRVSAIRGLAEFKCPEARAILSELLQQEQSKSFLFRNYDTLSAVREALARCG